MAAGGMFKPLKTEKMSPLESGIETVFLTLVRQKPHQFSNAIDCVANCINRVPSEEVLSSIIFEILMDEDCDKKTAIDANHYLNTILAIFPSSDSSRRLFYRSALAGKKEFGFTNLWSVFSHIVNSCCIHYKIWGIEDQERSPIPYPNCDILVDFYVRVMIDNYDYLLSERVFYEGAEKSLVMDLFWPTELSNLSAAKGHPSLFLQWINKIYSHSARVSKVNAIKSLHKLLNLMIQCIMHFEYSQSKTSTSTIIPDSLICNSLCVLDTVKVIFNICKEIFNSLENFRRFLHHLSSKALQFKVCEYKLYEILNSKQPSERKLSSCTLQTIVTVYMLPKKLTVGTRGRPKKQPQNDLLLEDHGKNENMTSNPNSKSLVSGESALHEFCRAKKPADLYQILTSDAILDVNEKNNLGQTPLHVACLSQSYLCAKILIEECSSEESKYKLNFSAADEEGLTSLHIAMKNNAVSIAKNILKCGGSKLLEVKDKCGRKPSHYASKETRQILREVSNDAESAKSAVSLKTITDLDVPTFQNFKEYAFYCHVLHFMVTNYAHIYNLFHVKRLINGNSSSSVEVLKHESKSCPHFKSCSENAVCSEDLDYIKMLPDIIAHFVKRMSECAKGKGLNLDLELFPSQVFAAVLD